MSESRAVQNMLRGGDAMRGASKKFESGVTSAPDADKARAQMREEELRRLDGRPLTKEEFIKQSPALSQPESLNYKTSLPLGYKILTQEKDHDGFGDYLADEFDRAGVKLTDEDRRKAWKIDKDSRRPSPGNRPVQKPKYKTEPTHF